MKRIVVLALLLCGCTADDDDSPLFDGSTLDAATAVGQCAASCLPACFTTKVGDCNGTGSLSCMAQVDLTNPAMPGSNLCFSNGFKIKVRSSSPALSEFYKGGNQCGYVSESTGVGTQQFTITFKDTSRATFASFNGFDTSGKKFMVTCMGAAPVAVDLTTSDCAGCGSFGNTPCPQGACVIP